MNFPFKSFSFFDASLSSPIQSVSDSRINTKKNDYEKIEVTSSSSRSSFTLLALSSSIHLLQNLNATSQILNKQPNSSPLISHKFHFISGESPMAGQFSNSVEFGLNLSKRIHHIKGSAPVPLPEMTRSSEEFLPTAPMCYAVIPDPQIVDNPDIRSYQPYVYGVCNPPALIPLQLHGIEMEIECCLDTAFVTVTGRWRVHCVTGSSLCDCQVAIPIGEQVHIYSIYF
jgi:hypothetical protein